MAHFSQMVPLIFYPTQREHQTHLRILLTGMSNMLANIVAAALAPAPDIAIVGSVGENHDVAAEVRAAHVDAVVAQTMQPQNGEAFRSLLLGFPALKVIAIADDGSSGFVHELRLVSSRLVELSSSTLQAALRGEPQPHWRPPEHPARTR
jgi:DNA-binding NarL/FixJ family response regulator